MNILAMRGPRGFLKADLSARKKETAGRKSYSSRLPLCYNYPSHCAGQCPAGLPA
jgi:hypothetical protein